MLIFLLHRFLSYYHEQISHLIARETVTDRWLDKSPQQPSIVRTVNSCEQTRSKYICRLQIQLSAGFSAPIGHRYVSRSTLRSPRESPTLPSSFGPRIGEWGSFAKVYAPDTARIDAWISPVNCADVVVCNYVDSLGKLPKCQSQWFGWNKICFRVSLSLFLFVCVVCIW